MPWASRKQQKFMYARYPELVAKAESEGKNYVKSSKPKKSTHETKKRHK